MSSPRLVSGDPFGIKLNASKIKTIIVSRSLKMHHSHPIFGTMLMKSFDLDILGITIIDSRKTIEN